ncbi:hypothetical protein NIT7321_03358 [Phaeobacter italicus]|uniref:Uncharacterized protein n=1 Tax=Phaeobacter italicus TaxID=481446 RepID=A0A0H5D5U9_9RHOB|nr:hypothetical protein [Phaeobacter italicus]CRL12481.1 hypothetical protein NIT7321_03358 [Phaeobacter italicus]
MDMRQPEAWQRHQLALTERMQIDVGRYTRPVMSIMATCSLVYLMTWGPLCAFWEVGHMPWLPLLVAAFSGLIVAMAFPAFALAVGIERYFCRRLRSLQVCEFRTPASDGAD